MSTVIRSGRREIWEALTAPDRRTRWGPLAFETVDAPSDYPAAGRPIRWRCRLGRIPLELRETPLQVAPGERLRVALGLGPLRLEQTFTLCPEPGPRAATRLHLKLVAPNAAPVVGGLMDRFEVRELVTELAGGALAALEQIVAARGSAPPPRPGGPGQPPGRLPRGAGGRDGPERPGGDPEDEALAASG